MTVSGLRALAFVTAGLAYAVIVIGFIVRITGSGMGCGPDWPLCNGRVIPAFTGPDVVIEWTHRVAVLGLGGLSVAVIAVAVAVRRAPGGGGPGGTLRPALLALAVLVIQSLIGRQAVRQELEAVTVVLHLTFAFALLAILLVIGLRAGSQGDGGRTQANTGELGRILANSGERKRQRAVPLSPEIARDRPRSPEFAALAAPLAWTAAGLGGLAVVLGGLTANFGATFACLGFPLCTGQWWPEGGGSGLAHIHWTHRLVAYALFAVSLALVMVLTRRGTPPRLRGASWTVFGLVLLQVVVAVVMVLALFPPVWRVLHAVVGTAVWAALVWLAWEAARRGEAGGSE